MATFLLVDGHSQAYRAYFALKTPLSTRSGELTAAVFGFARKLLSVLREQQPEYVAVAFDLGDTWRHAAFSEYKATRERMPDDMRSQLERIQQFLRVFNIPIVTYPDYEADDVLGTLARQAAAQGQNVLILTGDRDMFQLVDDRIRILYTSGGPKPQTTIYGPAEVKERYGLTPQQFVDLKALTGDASDNIPGVPGIGEKTAVKLLQEHGSLEAIYAHVDAIGGQKMRQSLMKSHEQVMLNRRLVTIATDLDLRYDPERCRLRDYDRSAVAALFEELEFRSLIRELPEPQAEPRAAPTSEGGQLALFAADGPTPPAVHTDYLIVCDEASLDALTAALDGAERLSFDVETDSTDAVTARLVGLGVAWAPGAAAYIPVAHHAGTQLPWSQVAARIAPYFAQPLPKLAHNGKYDLTVCRRHGLQVAGPIHDTMLLAWLLDPSGRSLGLKAQAAAELGWQMTELSDLIGSGRKQITMESVDISAAAAYCGADVDATLQIFDRLAPRVSEAGLWEIYSQIELPLLPVLTDMEMTGIGLDTGVLAEMSTQMAGRLAELEQELFALVGHDFNLRSTQQMSQVLFNELRFPTRNMRKTQSGHYSTAVDTLERLAALSTELSETQRRVLTVIFEQRQLEKLRSTYIDNLPNLVNPATGRVHTSFNQTGAVTGRMSSSNPNLQNIPIRTELGREIRRAFVPAAGWLLLSADYSQVELRILAHIAHEEKLIDSFRADEDIHAATAARLFHVPIEEVDRSQRSLAKTINFATVYGSSAFGISSRTEMDPQQAQTFLDQYFATYPAIKAYIADTTAMARREGYVQTLLGRKRFFPELKAADLPHNQRGAIERAAINAPIQGTAADIMKLAMVCLHEELAAGGYQARMLLQVHDELVLELPPEERAAVVALVRRVMETVYPLDVPLKADVEMGPNWYNLEPA